MRGLALILAAAAGPAAAQLYDGTSPFAESVDCGGVTATLYQNHPDFAGDGLRVGAAEVTFDVEPNYSGPVCVTRDGRPWVGVVEYMGNAYEVYHLIDPTTLERAEIEYQEAEALGWWD